MFRWLMKRVGLFRAGTHASTWHRTEEPVAPHHRQRGADSDDRSRNRLRALRESTLTPIDFSRGYNLWMSVAGGGELPSARDGWGPSVLSVSLFGVSRVASTNERVWADLGPAGRRLAGFLF